MKLKTLLILLFALTAACAFGQTQRATNFIAANNITAGALTSGRVVFAGTGGLLADSATLTYNSGTGALTATSFVGNLALGNVTGLGANVGTALAIAIGSAGAPVTFNGALGTPSSGTATNLTGTAAGLTAGTASAVAVGGITGLGTNVATALAVNVGSAGAVVVNGGALGTPSSGTLTNATGLPVAGGGTGVATLTAYAPVFGGTTGTGAVQSGTTGTQGQVMVSNGAGVLPAFEALDLADADAVTNVLPPANGGSGVVKLATFHIDGGGSAITTGTISGTARIVNACTITGYSITATGATGTNTITLWIKETATSIPVVGDIQATLSLTTGTAVTGNAAGFSDATWGVNAMARCAATVVDGAALDLTVTLYGTLL